MDKNRRANRRNKANLRERNRMHGLNAALDELRKKVPYYQSDNDDDFQNPTTHKLTKIETIRLAQNYITLLAKSLKENKKLSSDELKEILGRGLSSTTSNSIPIKLKIDNSIAINLLQSPISPNIDSLRNNMIKLNKDDVYRDFGGENYDFYTSSTTSIPIPGNSLSQCNYSKGRGVDDFLDVSPISRYSSSSSSYYNTF